MSPGQLTKLHSTLSRLVNRSLPMARVTYTRLSSVQKCLICAMFFFTLGASWKFFGRQTSTSLSPSLSGASSRNTQRWMSMNAKTITQDAISQNNVMVFSKTYCPYCTKAKGALQDLGIKVEVYELDVRKDGAEIQAALQELTGQRTVPSKSNTA